MSATARQAAGSREFAARPVSQPHDRHEREADRAADVVAQGGSVGGWSFSAVPASTARPVQRQEAGKDKSDDDKKKEVAKKVGEAALETKAGKELKDRVMADPVVKAVTSPYVVVPAIAGGVAGLAATGKELPIQPPEMKLDRITPGLSAKVTYEGPVNAPTFVGLTLTYKEQGPKGKKATDKDAIAADVARLRAQQQMFKPASEKAAEKQAEDEMVQAWIRSGAGLTIPLTTGQPDATKKDETPVQRAPASTAGTAPSHANVDEALATPGRPLDAHTRHSMEARFGYDFSRVRIHDDARAAATAASIGASAFTVGQDIVFGGGQYDASRPAGRQLIAHELAHVVQQAPGVPRPRSSSSTTPDRHASTAPEPRVIAEPEGERLPDAKRFELESRFGQPLRDVRIYAGPQGRRVTAAHSAVAVALDSNLFFAAGAWAPGTELGDRILRHEVAHLVQARMTGVAPWAAPALEAEAELAAARHAMPIRGAARRGTALHMTTFVSTVGGAGYLENAVKFYALWEGETAKRIGSYQDVVDDLAKETTPLTEFRIVAHGTAYNLFLPLLAQAKDYADRPTLGVQTQEQLAAELGKAAHPTGDETSRVYGWLSNSTEAQPLLVRLGLTGAPTGVVKEFMWWVVDEHYAVNATESGQGKQSSAADRAKFKGNVQDAQTATKTLAARRLPPKAMPSDLDELRTRTLAVFDKAGWTWPAAPGQLKDQLKLFEKPEAAALLREVKAGTFETKVKSVKRRVSDKTYVEIRGCNIGQNDDYLNGIREFFGTKPDRLPSISAPKLYQFFGTPGVQVLPEGGKKTPAVAASLKFLFEETFDDTATAKTVERAVKKAGLASVGGLAEILRHADVRAEFERWWQMKQAAAGATSPIAAATLSDFQDFLTTSPRTFPVNAPGVGSESLFFLVLIPSSAIPALIAWVKDQGYTLPGGTDLTKHFTGGSTKWDPARFSGALSKVVVDWLGDAFPVPRTIFFPEDPEYKANIRRLP